MKIFFKLIGQKCGFYQIKIIFTIKFYFKTLNICYYKIKKKIFINSIFVITFNNFIIIIFLKL